MSIKKIINKIINQEESTHTVAEVRAKRKAENEWKAQTHKQTIGMMIAEVEKRIEKIKELLGENNSADELSAYVCLVSKDMEKYPDFLTQNHTEEEYVQEEDFLVGLIDDMDTMIRIREDEKLRSSFQYSSVSLDDMILGMKDDADEYNRQEKKNRIGGGLSASSLGAFDAVRKKQDMNGNGSGGA